MFEEISWTWYNVQKSTKYLNDNGENQLRERFNSRW